MRGRKNPDKVPANHLPPCRVCGEASTGFHYGVITCIACKGFFRRSLARTDPYPCLQNHLCRIGLCNKRRQLCPKCRYDKCVKVGMSREGCKVGRYSRDKKFEYHKEAMEQEKLSQTGQASSSPPSLSSTLTAATSSSPPSSSSSSSLTSSVSALPGQSSEGNIPRPDNHAPRPDSHAPRPHSHAPLHNGHPPDNPTHEACSTYTHHEDDNDTDNYNDSDDGGDDDYHHKNDDADNGDKTDPRHHHHHQNYHTSDPDEPKDDSTRHQGNDLHHHHSNQEDSLQFDVDEIGVEMFEILSVSAFGDCDDGSDDNDDNDDNNKGADDDDDENNDDNKGDQFYRDHTLPKKSKKTFLELQPLGKHSFHSSSETENISLTTPPCETLVSGSPLLRLPRYAPPTKPQPLPLRQCETDSSSTFLLGQQQQQNDLDLNHTVCEIDTVALGPVEKNRSNKNNSNTNNNNNNNDNDNNNNHHHQALIDATIQATQSETHPDPSVDFPEVLDTLEFDESCFPSNVLPRMTGSSSLSPTTTLHPFPPSFDNDSSWAVNLLRQFNDVAASSGHLVTGFSLKGEGDENPQTERSGGGALDAGTYAKDCVGRRGNVGVVMPNNVGIITSLSSGVGTTLHNGVVRTPSANTDTPAPSPKDRDPISSPVPYAVGTGNNPSGSEFNPHTNVYHNRNYRNYSQTGSEEVAIPNNLVTGTPHCDSPLYEPSHTLQRMENNNINNHGVNTIPNTQFNSDHSATPRVPPTHLNNSSALPLTPTTPPPPPPPFPHHHHNNEPTTLALQSTSLRIDPSPPPPDVTARILSVTQIRFQLTSYEKTELENILQNGIQTINIPAIKALLSQSNTPDNHFIKNTQPPLSSPTDLTSTPRNPEAEKQEPTGETLLEDIGAKASSSVSIRRLKDYCPADLRGAIDFEYDAREMEAMFEDIQTRHTRVYGDRSKLTSADMTDALDAYWNICQLQENLQGPLNIMDDETYYRVLESTGIDIDRRRVYFLSYLEYFDSWMVRDIRFFKNLPGFKQFTLHDRTALTKSTFSVFGFVKDFRGWDRTRRIVVGEEGLTGFCADKTVRVFPDFALTLAGLLEVYDDLLTYDPCLREMMLIKALLVMTPYTYESLEHPELVCQWYNKYLSCMLCLIRKLHGTGPYADERFSQLLAVLEKLKHIRGTFREFMLSTVEQLLKLIDSEQAMIFREVFAYFKYEADDLDT